jgi:hypothetical protein
MREITVDENSAWAASKNEQKEKPLYEITFIHDNTYNSQWQHWKTDLDTYFKGTRLVRFSAPINVLFIDTPEHNHASKEKPTDFFGPCWKVNLKTDFHVHMWHKTKWPGFLLSSDDNDVAHFIVNFLLLWKSKQEEILPVGRNITIKRSGCCNRRPALKQIQNLVVVMVFESQHQSTRRCYIVNLFLLPSNIDDTMLLFCSSYTF